MTLVLEGPRLQRAGPRMHKLPIGLLTLLALWSCGGDSSTAPIGPDTQPGTPPGTPPPASGEPTRIVFQHPATGPEFDVGPFEDSVPVGPGLRYVVRAVPMDAAGNAYTNLTLNWSVSGGGSLDHAVTSPAGGNDATMNAWTIGQQDGVQSITVTLPAHPGVQGVLHVRAVHLQMTAISPPNASPFTLGAGQQIPLTAQLRTTSGQPFEWSITFSAIFSPYFPCSKLPYSGGLGRTPSDAPRVEVTAPTDAQGKATVIYTAPTTLTSGCQGFIGAAPALSPSGIGGLNTNVFDVSWLANITPSPATRIIAISGDGQAASPGATLGQPLVVQVQDAFGNGVPGATVNWSTSSGLVSPAALTTDAGGRLSAKWIVGAASGTQTATASIGAASVTFTVTVS
jgi:adhesin/invasin